MSFLFITHSEKYVFLRLRSSNTKPYLLFCLHFSTFQSVKILVYSTLIKCPKLLLGNITI